MKFVEFSVTLSLGLAMLNVAPAPASAGIFECYAAVHEGCYNDGQKPCTSEEYDFWLATCDADAADDSGQSFAANMPAAMKRPPGSQVAKMKRFMARKGFR